MHIPGNKEPKIRYGYVDCLGKSAFREVTRVLNLDTGRLMAVKKVFLPDFGIQPPAIVAIKREMEALARISHVS